MTQTRLDEVLSAGGGPFIMLGTYGFALYPTDQTGGRCDAIGLLQAPLCPHRSELIVPKPCFVGAENLTLREDQNVFIVDVSGYDAAMEGDGDAAQVVRGEPLEEGASPPCDPRAYDMNLVPDFETQCSGLILRADWRRKAVVNFVFNLKGGRIAAVPEAHTKRLWRWSLDNRDMRYRISGLTIHTDQLRHGIINFTSRLTGAHAGILRVKPYDVYRPVAFVMLINLPDPTVGLQDSRASGFSHFHAMTRVCDTAPDSEIRICFGQQLDDDCDAPSAIASLTPGSGGVAEYLARVAPLFPGDPTCAGRRMSVR